MWFNLFIGFVLLVFSIFVHAYATRFVMRMANRKATSGNHNVRNKEVWTSLIVLIMFAASLIEVLAWALTFMCLGAIEKLEEALYFSTVTFTTLGYGDITLSETYRLLASVEAANGIIIFGWSTAITMAVVQKFYFKTKSSYRLKFV